MAFNKVAQADSKIFTVDPIRSKQDIKNMCDWFYSKGWEKYAVILYFGCNSGLRVSDILGFHVKEVYGQKRVRIREQKTGKIKEFPLNERLQKLLWEFCRGRDMEEWLFEGRGHRKLERSQVYRRLNEAVTALGINCHIGTHTMRKTFGYHSYRQYKDITLLQTIYNHTSPEVTKRYIGITQDEIDAYYLNFNLDIDYNEFDLIKPGHARSKAEAMISLSKNYINNGGIKYKPFAEIILEIASAPPKPSNRKIRKQEKEMLKNDSLIS